MPAILLTILILVYAVIATVIVYHLHTYTINKKLARHAIVFFIMITLLLVGAQIVTFLFIPFDLLITGPELPSPAGFGRSF